jgi:Mg2+ and Co2+ transporter CorA
LGHSHETLDIAVNIIQSISSEHRAFWAECKGDSPDNRRLASQVQRRLSSLSIELGNITRRSVSLKERLQYEINLAHNMVSHRNTDMMRTISAITLLFLPGTFVSGLFSSAFFQFSSDSQEWVVAKNFWLYWVIVIPLTIATLFVWLMKYHRDEIRQCKTFFWTKIGRRKPRGSVSDLFAKNP